VTETTDRKHLALLATSWLTGDQLSRLTREQLSRLTREQLSWLTREQLSWLTGDQLSWLTGDQLSRLTREQLSWLTGEQLSRLTGDRKIPRMENLYSRMAADVQSKARTLRQSTFGPETVDAEHVCRTPMCIAGHTVNLAGAEGYALKEVFGFACAARLIHIASCPTLAPPRYDTYPDEWALAYIEEAAALETAEG